MPANPHPTQSAAERVDDSLTLKPCGFWLGLRLPHGVLERDQIRMQRNLEDRVADLGLRIGGGTQRHLFIQADDLELSLADPIELADWCLTATSAIQISVTAFTGSTIMVPVTSKVLRINRWDLAAIGVSLLYRMGRISPEQYTEILGGFVANPSGELFA